MLIRPYTERDAEDTLALFRRTVKTVCAADYSAFEIEAWIRREDIRAADWHALLVSEHTLVALDDGGRIAGFGSCVPGTGLIDFLYTASDRHGRGVGSALLAALEEAVDPAVKTLHAYVSITARPFFEHRGWETQRANTALRRFHRAGAAFEAALSNFLMCKSR